MTTINCRWDFFAKSLVHGENCQCTDEEIERKYDDYRDLMADREPEENDAD